uniref:Secreted protein n=1 Tax=Aegilops tauschii subsp. strangulata TaxID=200361 RepID=A0A453PSH3_AEGTS
AVCDSVAAGFWCVCWGLWHVGAASLPQPWIGVSCAGALNAGAEVGGRSTALLVCATDSSCLTFSPSRFVVPCVWSRVLFEVREVCKNNAMKIRH